MTSTIFVQISLNRLFCVIFLGPDEIPSEILRSGVSIGRAKHLVILCRDLEVDSILSENHCKRHGDT